MSQSHFQNENVSVDLSREAGCRVHMDITVSPQATQAAYQKAVKNINKETLLPGFRKGKAPEALIVKNYSRQVESEWKDILLNTSFNEALTISKVMPFNDKSVKKAGVKKHSLEEGAVIFVDYESQPEIPHVNPEELVFHSISEIPATEEEVDESIEHARMMKAKWEPIEGRGVEEGDYVDLDIVKIGPPSQVLCKDTRFEAKSGKMGKWMHTLVLGLKPGESAEGVSEQDEKEEDCKACADGTHQHPEFQPTHCRITVKKILKPDVPALDDEFAKSVNFPSVAELRNKIRDDLKKRAEREYQEAKRKQIEAKLLQKFPFEVPYSLVEGQMEDRREEVRNDLSQHISDADKLETETEKVVQEVKQRILHDFQLYFLTNKIAQENKLQVTQEDLMGELMHQMWLRPSGQSYIHDGMNPDEVRSRLYSRVLIDKTLDFLIEKASKN